MGALTFDEFAPPASAADSSGSGLKRVVIDGPTQENAPKSAPLTFDEFNPEAWSTKAGRVAKDVAKSAISGLDKGVAGIAGAPADIGRLIEHEGMDRLRSLVQGKDLDDVHKETDANALISPETMEKWGSKAAHEASPLQHAPETDAGRWTEAATEFIPSVVAPAGVAGRIPRAAELLGLGAAPGIASKAAGDALHGTQLESLEPYARGAAAIAAGGVGAIASAPSTAGRAVSRAARGATPAQIDQAERLVQDAQRMGTPLTRAEAVQHVTGGATNLGNLQRVTEGAGELRPMMAARPGQVDAAARREFDNLAPPSANPSGIGPAVGAAAEGAVQDVTQAINRHTRPLYDAASTQRVGPQVHAALIADPLYARTLQEVRANPALNRTVEHLPDDSVGVIDLVQRRLREQADAAAVPGQAHSSNLAAANLGDARTAPLAAADTVTGSRPGVQGTYEAARAQQQALREQYLEPLMNGPVGKLADRHQPTKRAISALFPENPLPNSQQEIGNAVRAVARRNRPAANDLVRAHTEMAFNEASQRLQSGANEFAGAGFAAVLRGNRQQAANLEAAITALQGPEAYRGFDRFLTVLEAQGSRQRIGSQTAFNQELQTALKQGGTAAEGLSAVASGGVKLPAKIMQRIEQWRLGRNVNEIADILTNPQGADLFRRLATAPPDSALATRIIGRLAYLGTRSAQDTKGEK